MMLRPRRPRRRARRRRPTSASAPAPCSRCARPRARRALATCSRACCPRCRSSRPTTRRASPLSTRPSRHARGIGELVSKKWRQAPGTSAPGCRGSRVPSARAASVRLRPTSRRRRARSTRPTWPSRLAPCTCFRGCRPHPRPAEARATRPPISGQASEPTSAPSRRGCRAPAAGLCRLLEGLLDAAAIPFAPRGMRRRRACHRGRLQARGARRGPAQGAVSYWASGLDELAVGRRLRPVDEFEYVSREAQVLGLAGVGAVGAAAQIPCTAPTFTTTTRPSRACSRTTGASGAELGKASAAERVDQRARVHLRLRGPRHAEFLGDIQGDIRACEASSTRLGNFSAAFDALRNTSAPSGANADFRSTCRASVRDRRHWPRHARRGGGRQGLPPRSAGCGAREARHQAGRRPEIRGSRRRCASSSRACRSSRRSAPPASTTGAQLGRPLQRRTARRDARGRRRRQLCQAGRARDRR